MAVIITGVHSWTSGPFSAVRPGEVAQDPVESSPREPIDEVVPMQPPADSQRSGSSMSSSRMRDQGAKSVGAALAAFPQIVHVLADPELHLGKQLSTATGLPVVSLEENSIEELATVLSAEEFAQGFILEGFPTDRGVAEGLDSLLSATSPNERRVLGWQAEKDDHQQIILDHYIDQGLLWNVPNESPAAPSEQVTDALLECMVGLPARK